MISLDPRHKINLIIWIPLWLCVATILADYVLIPKNIKLTTIESAHVYKDNMGKPCKLSIHVPSKWGNKVFETRTSTTSRCAVLKTGDKVSITHTRIFNRWLTIKLADENYYFVDNQVIYDLIYVLLSLLISYGFYKKKAEQYFKFPNLILMVTIILSLSYWR